MDIKKFYDAVNAANARLQEIAGRIETLYDQNKIEEGLALKPELDQARKAYDDANQMYLSVLAMSTKDGDGNARKFVPMGGDREPQAVTDMRASREYVQTFFKAMKNGVSPKTIEAGQHRAESYKLLLDALTETGGSPAGSEGGFLNPIDFDNLIHTLTRQYFDLATIVNVEEVTAHTGWRAIETAVAMLPFALMTESPPTDMAEAEEPTFTKISYTISDYGGYMPISNDLLNDTPANIMNYLARWVARKVVLTDNSLVLADLNAISAYSVPAAITTLDGQLKNILNLGLDPDISVSSKIICNQTGFDALDQLVDGLGRPLLQPDPTNATLNRLFGREVVKLADRLWPNHQTVPGTDDYTRFLVGAGEQAEVFFRRSAMEMAATTIGGDAWRKNTTEVRAIMRADAQPMDTAAMTCLHWSL
jgi:HK97 family phage major capsid protein